MRAIVKYLLGLRWIDIMPHDEMTFIAIVPLELWL